MRLNVGMMWSQGRKFHSFERVSGMQECDNSLSLNCYIPQIISVNCNKYSHIWTYLIYEF